MSTLIKLLFLGLNLVVAAPPLTDYIKHGDKIFIHDLVIQKDGLAYRRKNAAVAFAKFVVLKDPYYPSKNDYILGGRTYLFYRNSTKEYCAFDCDRKVFHCDRSRPTNCSCSRILDKHGEDQKPLYSSQLIKLRMKNNDIDCSSSTNMPLSCLSKQDQKYYSFVLFKTN